MTRKEVVTSQNTVFMPDGAIMPEILTAEEAIRFLRLEGENNPRRTLKYYRDKGKLCGVKIGRRMVYPKEALLNFVQTVLDGVSNEQ